VPDASFLAWPFFEDRHRAFADDLRAWAAQHVKGLANHSDVDRSCRALVRALGQAGWLRAVVPAAYGGSQPSFDVRTLCLAREILAYRDGLADFAFAMQGLGTGSITLFGSDELKSRYLPRVARGEAIAAFALSEPEAGSDVAALATRAAPDGSGHLRIDGLKTWISNGGIADYYVVFATVEPGSRSRGVTAFLVEREDAGVSFGEPMKKMG
jgi:acyl-CoA dehydrogenase